MQIGSESNIESINVMKWKYNDGGRAAAGYKGKARDCVCRAICIAAQLDYTTVYNQLDEVGAQERTGKRRSGKSSARTGVHIPTMRRFLAGMGAHDANW